MRTKESKMTKEQFFKNLDEIVPDEIYLTESLDELDKEIQANHWSIGIDSDAAQLINNHDLQDFLRKVIQNRVKQLEDSDKKMGLLFYIWFDKQACNLNFNLINSEHEHLPFGAKLEFVDSIDQVINDCLKSKYLDGISWNELHGTDDLIRVFECNFNKNDWKDLIVDLKNWTPFQLELFVQGILGYEAQKGTIGYGTKVIPDQTLVVPYIFDVFYNILKLSNEEGIDCGDLYQSTFEVNEDFFNYHFEIIIRDDEKNISKLEYILEYFIRIAPNDKRVTMLEEKIKKARR